MQEQVPSNVTVTSAGNISRLTQGYFYDALGSVSQRSQYWDANGFQETFVYDVLGRVESSVVLGQPLQSFSYDAAGNLKTKTGTGTGPYEYGPQGDGVAQPHAVKSIPGIGNFAYDENGNLTSGAGRTISWNSFDMPVTIANATSASTFVYGPERQRLRQDRRDGTQVNYAGKQEVETKAGQVTVKTYWPGGVGVEIDRPGSATELNWTHTDQLGSIVAISDRNGSLVEKLAFDAWGKRRTLDGNAVNGTPTPDAIDGKVDNKGYTGHEMLDQLDLVHMNGRVYDPFITRVLSADPIISDPQDGQSYNRYSYVHNNPTNFTDPTGFDLEPNNGCSNNGGHLTNASCQRQAATQEAGEAKEKPAAAPSTAPADTKGKGNLPSSANSEEVVSVKGSDLFGESNKGGKATTSSDEQRDSQNVAGSDKHAFLGSYLPGTELGKAAAEGYADKYVKTGNPLYMVPLSLSALWMPDTAVNTAVTLGTLGSGKALGMVAGPMAQWVRVGSSYSKAGQFPVSWSIRWGASPIGNGKYIKLIPSPALQDFNQFLRGLKLPGSGWRTADPGHFHLW